MEDLERTEQHLVEWVQTDRDRDPRILAALLAGHTKHHIHQLTGISRNTLHALLKEYPVIDTAAVLRAKARVYSRMTAAEFDHSLWAGDGQALQWMNAAAHDLANTGHPEVQPGDGEDAVQERAARAESLWTRVWPEVQAMTDRAKAMKFTGWSDAAKAAGQKIRYAD